MFGFLFTHRWLAALTWAATFSAACGEEPSSDGSPWSFRQLQQRAKELSTRPHENSPALPPELRDLNYDSYRLIAFEHEKASWKDEQLPFWLECFHRGYLYKNQVDLNLVRDGRSFRLPFQQELFQYRGELKGMDPPQGIGFAGFRILGRFENSRHPLEIASFLGASYFRAIGQGQVYGTSARGLAVDIGLPKAEEFPVFREFWIERPQSDAGQLRLWALLDSPSVTGAYQFTLRPAEATTWDVDARLFFRRQVENVGLAPLTSMWMWGDGRPQPAGDFRPKVHDADGLLVWDGEENWVWRPLGRQDYPSLSHYDFTKLRGFGLLQRDRRPESFRDDEAKYHLRPSVWIEPQSSWPEGAVELLELPAEHEGIDSIAAWWKPRQTPAAGDTLPIRYRVSFLSGNPPQHELAKATATRVTRRREEPTILEIDFTGAQLSGLAEDAAIEPNVTCDRGKVTDVQCRRQGNDCWRLRFLVHPSGSAPVELRAVLTLQGQTLSETWRYLCRT